MLLVRSKKTKWKGAATSYLTWTLKEH
uniref:Uncharacterized protein n=1 Tax=Anguilla anguilla TaxID=7936 RepID=A0A0E9T440_ANGAN